MNRSTIARFRSVEAAIAAEKGPFVLFALVLRPDAMGLASTSSTNPQVVDRWDVLVSAPWMKASGKEDLDYVVKKIQEQMKPDELRGISRVAFVSVDSALAQGFNSLVEVEHGEGQLTHAQVGHMLIDRAIVITSRSPENNRARAGRSAVRRR